MLIEYLLWTAKWASYFLIYVVMGMLINLLISKWESDNIKQKKYLKIFLKIIALFVIAYFLKRLDPYLNSLIFS